MKLVFLIYSHLAQASALFGLETQAGIENSFFPSSETTVSFMKRIKYSEIKKLSLNVRTTHCPESVVITNWTCQSCSENTTFIKSFEDPLLQTRGMIVATKRSIVLTFRGTENLKNLMLDLKAVLVPFPVIPDPQARVHKGFLEAMQSLAPFFIKEISKLRSKQKYRNHEIVVAGHSMGGSMSALAAVLINYRFNLRWRNLKLVTYGQPRTGNAKFAHWFNKQSIATARVVYENDIVPHIFPTVLKFSHHHNEVYIHNGIPHYCRTDFLEDPDCSYKVIPLAYSGQDHMGYFKHIATDHCTNKLSHQK